MQNGGGMRKTLTLRKFLRISLHFKRRGGWTATRKASCEICMRFADWLHSRVDLSEVNISRIWKFSKDETLGL